MAEQNQNQNNINQQMWAAKKAEKSAKLPEIKALIDAKVKEYNEAMLDHRFDDASKLDSEIAEKVSEYGELTRDICLMECAEQDDPMLEAVKRLEYETLAVKDSKEDGSDFKVRTVVDRVKPIDPVKLDEFVSGGIGHNKNWELMIEQFNLRMTLKIADDIGVDPKGINDSYYMSKLARDIDLGKTPCSKTNLLKTLQLIVSAMIGDEYKAITHDVNYILAVYSKKGRKALTVTASNHKQMRQIIMEICHRIVMNSRYDIDYKKIK